MIHLLARYVYTNMPSGPSDAFARQMAPLMSFLAAQLAPDRAPRVQFQAALAHLTLIGGAQSDALVDLAWVLGDVLAHPEKYSADRSSFRIESDMKAALNGIEYLPRAWRMAILAEALPSAQYAGDAHLIGYALLETIFFGTIRTNEVDRNHMRPFLRRARLNDKDPAERPENSTKLFRMDIREQSGQLRPPGRRYLAAPLPADLVALSATERRMLRLVLDTDLVWMLHSNLLAVYGLPVERAEARALLDEADAANAAESGKR
jgi:acyl-CoA synthetase (AMP-forming)/AMP-acid ligase II